MAWSGHGHPSFDHSRTGWLLSLKSLKQNSVIVFSNHAIPGILLINEPVCSFPHLIYKEKETGLELRGIQGDAISLIKKN